MENIENIKQGYKRFFAKKYFGKTENSLSELERYECSNLAEMWAYIDSVLPEGYGEYSISDFHGHVSDKTGGHEIALTEDIIIPAKNKICQYCWNLSWNDIVKQKKEKNNIGAFLREKNIMMKRLKQGDNIVIFGSSEKPIGRTMVASIIMKEAIKLRATNRARGQTYDWIDFPNLFNVIKEDSMELVDYKSCDWLVVDNISRKSRSAKQTILIVDVIDSFFIERFKNKLPTILVFKSDIRDKSLSIEKTWGIGINRIIESQRTCKIALSENSFGDT
jgi:DNA replication protein DnaC